MCGGRVVEYSLNRSGWKFQRSLSEEFRFRDNYIRYVVSLGLKGGGNGQEVKLFEIFFAMHQTSLEY